MTHPMLDARAREVADRLSRELPRTVIVVAPDGVILSWNVAATALFGYSSAAVPGRSIFDTMVPPEHVEENRHRLKAAAQAGSAMYEGGPLPQGGHRLRVEVGLRLMNQGEDGVTLLVVSERDIPRGAPRRRIWVDSYPSEGATFIIPAARRASPSNTLLYDRCDSAIGDIRQGGDVTQPCEVLREPLRVLVVEHDRSDADLCLLALEHAGFEVHGDVVSIPEDFAGRALTGRYDVVLADYRLPSWTGLDALELLRALGLDVPLILVTGTLGEERAIECLRKGVADYVLKQNMAHLPVAVRRALEERRAFRERASAEHLTQKLTLAVDQCPASVVITDTSGSIHYVNQRFVEVTGYSAEDVVGRNPRLLKSGKVPAEVYRELWRTIRRGQVWRGELLNRRKDGAVYWDALSISPVRDTAGNITDFLAIQEDITERKQTEKVLKESEARFRKIIEASFDGIDVTQDGVVLEANRGFAEMFGYTLGEVIGRPVVDLIAGESEEATLQRMEQHIEGSYELIGKRKDGRKILLEATARTHEIGGRPARVTALRDVTERRTAEEQFRQGQKMEAVGRLAGRVAHDFNNLLTVITSYAEILLGDLAANDVRREDVERIQKAARDAASLTAQLLAFSRERAIAPRPVALEELVAGSAKMLEPLLGEDIELITALSQEPLTVTIDPGQLKQIIMNLAVNARDAMPTGGTILMETAKADPREEDVRAHQPMSGGEYAMLIMRDTGTGMDEQTRARIFEPFFSTKAVGKATGFGLATVYGIVRQNGGFVRVYTEPGRGATFKVYLPLSDPSTATEQARTASGATLTGTETVLITEIAPAVRAMLRQTLERYGYKVLEAPNGKAALRFAADRSRPIHLLLTDLVMPEVSGRQLAEQFTALRPEVKVLYMSGYTDDAVLRHGGLEGVACLQKPFTPQTLARGVRERLDAP